MDDEKSMDFQEHAGTWRFAGSLAYSWGWRTACRHCGPMVTNDTELEQGKVSMPASEDYITPEIIIQDVERYFIGNGDDEELKQDRVPMLAMKGYTTPEFFLQTSPSNDLESESSVQDPLGFADLGGFISDGCVEAFQRRPQTDPMEDRVSMPAPEDYITPEIIIQDVERYFIGYGDEELKQDRVSMLATKGYTTSGFLLQASPSNDLESESSVQDPLGFTDPGGFSYDGCVENFQRRLQTRLKQDKVSMLATKGYITPEIIIQASTSRAVEDGLSVQGLLGYTDPGGFSSEGSVEYFQRRPQTGLQQDEVSMLATMGYISPETITQASPSTAFEDGLRVQDSLGFTDPGGFSSDSSVENFQRRPQTELKHDKVSMLAAMLFNMGHITLEITGLLPGYLSPTMRANSTDVWNHMANISKVPSKGWDVRFWDPAGFSAAGNVENFQCRRQTKLKNGKASMLANMGHITP